MCAVVMADSDKMFVVSIEVDQRIAVTSADIVAFLLVDRHRRDQLLDSGSATYLDGFRKRRQPALKRFDNDTIRWFHGVTERFVPIETRLGSR